ncbi:MAG: ribosome-associated translation inhibitor RaiA [Nocardioides sp.]
MDIVITGRHCDLSEGFRGHVEEKLARLEKHDHRIVRMAVEVEAERNPRLSERAMRVELTAVSRGPVIRAEARAADKMAALDLALDKIAAQMRRASDRRRNHRGRRPQSGASEAVFEAVETPAAEPAAPATNAGPIAVDGEGPLVVRQKVHAANPMTLEEALYEMELVGHDFFLFVDADSGRPSVVYRRVGYDFGVIGLELAPVPEAAELGV